MQEQSQKVYGVSEWKVLSRWANFSAQQVPQFQMLSRPTSRPGSAHRSALMCIDSDVFTSCSCQVLHACSQICVFCADRQSTRISPQALCMHLQCLRALLHGQKPDGHFAAASMCNSGPEAMEGVRGREGRGGEGCLSNCNRFGMTYATCKCFNFHKGSHQEAWSNMLKSFHGPQLLQNVLCRERGVGGSKDTHVTHSARQVVAEQAA